MSIEKKTDPEKAQEFILTKNPLEFQQTLSDPINNVTLNIVILYFPAQGQLTRLIQKNKEMYSTDQIENFRKNSTILQNVKRDVEIQEFETLRLKYNEAIIIGSLVQLIRDCEANIKTYSKYMQLKEKFLSWPKKGIQNQKILLAWKDFSNALRELEEWLAEKKNSYLPILEKLIGSFESENGINVKNLYQVLQTIPEKKSYYIICNILLTNPILRKEFLSISQLTADKLLLFEQTLYLVLDLIYDQTADKSLKGLIILFKMQIKDQRHELLTDKH